MTDTQTPAAPRTAQDMDEDARFQIVARNDAGPLQLGEETADAADAVAAPRAGAEAPARMKAAVKTREGRFEIQEVETPRLPADDWVLVRLRVAGICGTDLRHWDHEDEKLEGHIMGHETAGDIAQVGQAVNGLAPGDRVVVETVLGDGVCDWCRARRYNICPHLYDVRGKTVSRDFAQYIVAPAHKCYRLPESVSYEQAALLDTYSVCLHAAHRAPALPNDKVAVIGAGPIGLGQVQIAKMMGADVIVCDRVGSALEVARRLGADEVVNSDNEDFKARVMTFTDGRGADVAYECAGGPSMPTTLKLATDVTRRGGKVAIVGGFDPGPVSIPLEWQKIQMSEIDLIPSASYALRDIYPEMQTCLDLMARGRLKADPLITHRVSLDRINEGFETDADKRNTGAIFVAIEL